MRPYRDLRGLPPALWLLCFAILLNRAGTMALPMLTLYLTQARGFSPEQAGWAFLVYGGVSLLAAPASGALSDRFGPRRVMIFALVGGAAALFVLPTLRALPAILSATAAWAGFAELFRPAGLAAVGLLAPLQQRKAAFALSRTAINLGVALGAPLAGFAAELDFAAVFWINGGMGLVVAALLSRQRFGRPLPKEPGAAAKFRPPRALLLLCLNSVLIGSIVFQFEGPLSLWVVEVLRGEPSDFTLLLALNAAIVVVLEVPVNTATAAWPLRRTLVIAALLLGAGFYGYSLAGGLGGAALATLVWTFGEMLLFPAQSAYVTAITPAHHVGRAMGLYSLSFGIAFSFGPALGNAVYARLSADAVWTGCLAAALLGALLVSRLPPAREEHASAA